LKTDGWLTAECVTLKLFISGWTSAIDVKRGMTMKKAMKMVAWAVVILWMASGCAAPKITGGPIADRSLADGRYAGEAAHGPVRVIAEVTIQNQRIVKIELLTHHNLKGKRAEQVVVRIVEEQSTSVDAVSGATVSSIAIMNAVEDAIKKARKKSVISGLDFAA
jgi:uncharacterized protein with FMN-binding domain